MKVLAIDQIASEAEEKPTVARAVTLEVTREQAQKILLATNIGWIVIAEPGDGEV